MISNYKLMKNRKHIKHSQTKNQFPEIKVENADLDKAVRKK